MPDDRDRDWAAPKQHDLSPDGWRCPFGIGRPAMTVQQAVFPIDPASDPRHSTATKLFYGAGAIAFGVKDNGFSVLLLLFYNQALDLAAWRAGLAIMLALVADAILDPLIGYASDHLHSRWGRRHPFMYAAALPVALSYLFLFVPPAGLGQQGLFWYLLCLAVLVRFFIALYEIPSSALIADLTQGYDQRTSYLSLRYVFGWGGGLTMSLLAFGVFLKSHGGVAGQMIPTNYRDYGIAASLIMLGAILMSSLGTHSSIPWLARPVHRSAAGSRQNPLREIASAFSSVSALTALLAYTLFALATGLSFALGPYFYSYFWGLTTGQISILVAGNFLSAAVALPLAPYLSRRLDKRRAAIWITVVVVVLAPLPLILSLLGHFPAAGTPKLIRFLFAFLSVTTCLSILQGIMFTAMLADVVEDNEVRTGLRAEGVFFAASTFVQKCVSGLGVFASSALLALAAFPARAVPGQVPGAILTRLGEYYVSVIIAIHLLSIGCAWLFRITRAVHAQNLQLLAERRAQISTPAAIMPML